MRDYSQSRINHVDLFRRSMLNFEPYRVIQETLDIDAVTIQILRKEKPFYSTDRVNIYRTHPVRYFFINSLSRSICSFFLPHNSIIPEGDKAGERKAMDKVYTHGGEIMNGKNKCWVCGKPATVTRVLGNPFEMFDSHVYTVDVKFNEQRCYCQNCFDERAERLRKENALYLDLKNKRLIERSIDRLEHCQISFDEYGEAIKAVEAYANENPNKFDSSYEFIAAVMLIHNHIRCIPQYKVGRYSIDFLLPDEFVVLEVDGDRHHTKKQRNADSRRDPNIKKVLGPEWDIVRIDGELIRANPTKLVEAIRKTIDYRILNKM